MTTYNTGNSLGSTDPRDLYDNAENLDNAVNDLANPTWKDRLGNTRTTLAGQIGYIGTGVDGAIEDYAAGQELTTFSTIIRYNGEFYRPSASATLPYTTTATLPDADANLVPVGDATLRQDLAGDPSVGEGATLVNGATLYVGSVAELEALSLPVGTAVYLTQEGRAGEFVIKAGTPPSDPQKGIYIVLANGNYAERNFESELNVKWFGAIGNGSNIDTTAIQACVDFSEATGDAVFFPQGSYLIDAEITCTTFGVHIYGNGAWNTDVVQSTATANIFNVSGSFCSISKIGLRYSVTPTGGAAILSTGGGNQYNNFLIRSCWDGIKFTSGTGQKAQDFDIQDYENTAIFVESTNDIFVSSFILNAGNQTKGRLGGIRLVNKVEAFVCSDGDILLGKYSMTMFATMYAQGLRPAYNNFTNVFFDSAALSTQINSTVETEFVGCWFSGGRTDTGYAGLEVTNSQSVRLTNSRFYNNGAQGALVASSAEDITFLACKFESNSVTAGVNSAHGLQFGDGCTQFQVIGCTASNSLFDGTQGYGVFIGASCDNYIVRDCNLIGNGIDGLADGAADSARKVIHGNFGYRTSNQGSVNIPVGQTVATVNHGLQSTPNPGDINLTFTTSPVDSSVTSVYVTSITSTSFQAVTNAAVQTQPQGIGWSARTKGA